jgi:PhzF family phenazine biosynthesis protein
LKVYIVDAFTDKLFSGNPAAVCPLDTWLPDDLMQKIAAENNLAETAFIVNEPDGYRIRWFTPAVEVDLCGHATLASAHVMFNHLDLTGDEIIFNSRSGGLKVRKDGKLLTLDFPKDDLKKVEITREIEDLFSVKPLEMYKGKTDYLLIFENEEIIRTIIPDLDRISKLDARGVIISAPGRNVDFVSRFFAPQSGINEDPVTGSAHTTLIPYWAGKLNKTEMTALQVSERGGSLLCKLSGDRVLISGNAITYSIGEIQTKNF